MEKKPVFVSGIVFLEVTYPFIFFKKVQTFKIPMNNGKVLLFFGRVVGGRKLFANFKVEIQVCGKFTNDIGLDYFLLAGFKKIAVNGYEFIVVFDFSGINQINEFLTKLKQANIQFEMYSGKEFKVSTTNRLFIQGIVPLKEIKEFFGDD